MFVCLVMNRCFYVGHCTRSNQLDFGRKQNTGLQVQRFLNGFFTIMISVDNKNKTFLTEVCTFECILVISADLLHPR